MADGLEVGLEMIDGLRAGDRLDGYYLLDAARADLLRRAGRAGEAGEAYRAALVHVTNDIERRYLERRIEEVSAAP